MACVLCVGCVHHAHQPHSALCAAKYQGGYAFEAFITSACMAHKKMTHACAQVATPLYYLLKTHAAGADLKFYPYCIPAISFFLRHEVSNT